jgi:hypothetical protein
MGQGKSNHFCMERVDANSQRYRTMNKSEFEKLHNRVQRSHDAVFCKANMGFSRSQRQFDGSVTEIEIVGIKAPEQLEDELLNLFIWLWNMKDYLKALCPSCGIASNRIEHIANAERCLTITADIANRAKHGGLRESRSEDFARLQHVGFSVPMSALSSIAFEKPAVRIVVGIPDNSEMYAEIGFDSGADPVDAFLTASQALEAWQVHAFPLVGISGVA